MLKSFSLSPHGNLDLRIRHVVLGIVYTHTRISFFLRKPTKFPKFSQGTEGKQTKLAGNLAGAVNYQVWYKE